MFPPTTNKTNKTRLAIALRTDGCQWLPIRTERNIKKINNLATLRIHKRKLQLRNIHGKMTTTTQTWTTHKSIAKKKWKLGGNGRNDTKEKCIYVWMLAYNDTTTIFCGTFSCGKRKIGHSPVYFSANKLAIVRHCLLITFHQMFVLFFQQKNPLTPRKNGREKNLTKQFFLHCSAFLMIITWGRRL